MSLSMLIAFALASFFLVIVPGPTVTVIIANSLRDGTRAGLLNVAGTQAGLLVMLLIVAVGLETVVALMAEWFHLVKLIGYFWQGVLVITTNPKILVLFGAFIPQFIDPMGSAFWQTLTLGGIFMIIATVFDTLYVLLASKAGRALTQSRVRWVEKISGSLLIAGGVWMAMLRRN